MKLVLDQDLFAVRAGEKLSEVIIDLVDPVGGCCGGKRERSSTQWSAPRPGSDHHDAGAWFAHRGTTRPTLDGITVVHDDAHDRRVGPWMAPLWANEISMNGSKRPSRRAQAERMRLKQWAWNSYQRGIAPGSMGFGDLVDVVSNPVVQNLRIFPPELLRQRNVIQCVRIEGATTRFDHQLDTGYTQALIAIQAGLSENEVVENFVAGTLHDLRHLAFAHSSERALGQFDPLYENHAKESGLAIERLLWTPETRRSQLIIADGVKGHSWPLLIRSDLMGDSNKDLHAGFIADMTGMADRISYSITDILDAVRAGRLAWKELPALIPNALDFLRGDHDGRTEAWGKADVDAMIDAGFVKGAPIFQARMRNVLVAEAAYVMREYGVVGMRPFGAAVFGELRDAGSGRLFRQPDFQDVEERMNNLCFAVLEDLEQKALGSGHGARSAKDLAIDTFARMSEDEIIDHALTEHLDLTYTDHEGIEQRFRAGEVRKYPRQKPPLGFVFDMAVPAPQRLSSLDAIVEVDFVHQTDESRAVRLTASETLEMVHLLRAKGTRSVPFRPRALAGSTMLLPPRGTEENLALQVRATEALTTAFLLAAVTDEKDPSRNYLKRLGRDKRLDPLQVMDAYIQHRRQDSDHRVATAIATDIGAHQPELPGVERGLAVAL